MLVVVWGGPGSAPPRGRCHGPNNGRYGSLGLVHTWCFLEVGSDYLQMMDYYVSYDQVLINVLDVNLVCVFVHLDNGRHCEISCNVVLVRKI